VENGVVYIESNGDLVALNARSEELLWDFPIGHISDSSRLCTWAVQGLG
jgi:outer membrane protein assembly factor BamB